MHTSDILYGSLALCAIFIILYRLFQLHRSWLRLLITLNLEEKQQRYWGKDGYFQARVKKFLVVAPLFRKRHNKEFTGWKSLNFGTIPSRLHAIFLVLYLASNVIYCCLLDYRQQPKAALIAEARGRTGHLAIMNMLPLFLFAARNNPLISVLGIPFDSFNLFHRWIGRVVVMESFAHTFLWGVNNHDALGMEGLTRRLMHDQFLIYGFVSAIALVLILIQSLSFIRHSFYEIFLHLHQFLVLGVTVGVLLHCRTHNLPQKPLAYTLLAIWAFERASRLTRILSNLGTRLDVEALPENACRLTFHIPRKWEQKASQYVYIYIPSVSLWMSHPFSVASISSDVPPGNCQPRTEVSLIVAARSGMTRKLFTKAMNSPNSTLSLRAFVEGPYQNPGSGNLKSYGTVVLFAGGVGVTCQLPHLKDILAESQAGRAATRKLVLVWAVRNVEMIGWARHLLDEIKKLSEKGKERQKHCKLEVLIFVSRHPSPHPPATPSSETDIECMAVQRKCIADVHERISELKFGQDYVSRLMGEYKEHVEHRRINVKDVVRKQFEERIGAMSIGVCGPGRFGDDVRDASRKLMTSGMLDFWEEAFTW